MSQQASTATPPHRLFLAPMEGVVDHHLRAIYADLGVDMCVTEFIRVTDTRLPEKVFKLASPEIHTPIQVPVRLQLLGSNPEMLAFNAAKAARMGAPGIDLNFGCPAKTVNRHRGGACLLQNTDDLYRIVKSVRDAVPEHVPVTAKIRLGFNAREGYIENALAIQEAGANELFVHARSKVDGYKPPAYWPCIAEIRRQLHISVIANGEIWSLEDFKLCRRQSQCHDFMLGRGLLAKPDLARQIRAHLQNKPFAPMSWEDICERLRQFHQATASSYPAKYCGNRLKQWLMYLRKHYNQAELFFQEVKTSRDPIFIEQCFERALRAPARASELAHGLDCA